MARAGCALIDSPAARDYAQALRNGAVRNEEYSLKMLSLCLLWGQLL